MLQLSNLCMSAKLILVMKLVVQEMTVAIIFPLRIRFIAN
ncbi:glycosyl transferase domain protein [Klebsiella pneumoniae VA360]|nr:glycosyl transferase domain protein [Klebsiella pneumoniae VA360]